MDLQDKQVDYTGETRGDSENSQGDSENSRGDWSLKYQFRNHGIANKFKPFGSTENSVTTQINNAKNTELNAKVPQLIAKEQTEETGDITDLKQFKIRDVVGKIIDIDKDEQDLTKHVTNMYRCLTLLADRFGEQVGYDSTASYLGRSVLNTPGNIVKGALGATAYGVGMVAAPFRAGLDAAIGSDKQKLAERTTASSFSKAAVSGVNSLWEGAKTLGKSAYKYAFTKKNENIGGAGYTRRRRNKHKTLKSPSHHPKRASLAATSKHAH